MIRIVERVQDASSKFLAEFGKSPSDIFLGRLDMSELSLDLGIARKDIDVASARILGLKLHETTDDRCLIVARRMGD